MRFKLGAKHKWSDENERENRVADECTVQCETNPLCLLV